MDFFNQKNQKEKNRYLKIIIIIRKKIFLNQIDTQYYYRIKFTKKRKIINK